MHVVSCVLSCQLLHRDSVYCVYCLFFFQAEDGIRDLVRSRGLGDVYRRQSPNTVDARIAPTAYPVGFKTLQIEGDIPVDYSNTVSYTHLTLPTSDLV